jgi:hypothetical protein
MICGINDGPVSCEVALRGQDVNVLGAGDPWRQLQGEGIHASIRVRMHLLSVGKHVKLP